MMEAAAEQGRPRQGSKFCWVFIKIIPVFLNMWKLLENIIFNTSPSFVIFGIVDDSIKVIFIYTTTNIFIYLEKYYNFHTFN